MKRFLICSLIAALPFTNSTACVSEGPTHNRYMFSVYRHNALTDGPAFLYDIDRYWQTYTGNDGPCGIGFYKWNRDEIMSTARKKNDTAMIAYLTLFNRYFKTCEAYTADAWNYPTKQQMAQRQKSFQNVLAAAKAYRGTALRPQYVLLQMRANMMLGYNNANIALWNSTASRLAESPWRNAMRNIYARALLKSGQRTRACNIYAEQGDVQSIKTVMRNFRNLAGIRTIFAQNPNATTLHFLVQDFVNNVQETLDQKAAGFDDAEWFKTIDAKQVYRKEAMAFVQFAVDAAANAKVKSPSLWLAAASMVDYLIGNSQRAIAEADKAVEADGTERMRDNARAIRLLVSTRTNKPTAEYTDYLLAEFHWLDAKIKEEGGTESGYDNHYADVKDRVVHRGLEPLFRKVGMDNTALALCAMMNAEGNYNNNVSYGPWNEYFSKMDSLKADRLADYYQYLSTSHTNAFETYCTQNTYHDADYFNDLIGTKLIAEGRFADAIPYLKKVGMSLLSTQMISNYSSQRHYDTPRWFGKQRVEEAYEPAKVTRNAKLDFCIDMTDRLSRYSLAREGSVKQQMAYDLAVRYYQASCYGDCWYLTHYYHSVMDSARSWEKDFAAETVKYLNVAKQSDDIRLRYRSLYALAFMPVEPWATVEYDTSNGYKELLVMHPKSAQYMALSDLDMFAKSYPNAIDDYTRRCDVLREFRLKRESQNF